MFNSKWEVTKEKFAEYELNNSHWFFIFSFSEISDIRVPCFSSNYWVVNTSTRQLACVVWRGGHRGVLNTAIPQEKSNKHRITSRKVNDTPSPQHVFLAPWFVHFIPTSTIFHKINTLFLSSLLYVSTRWQRSRVELLVKLRINETASHIIYLNGACLS